jgi:GT2 family glycosyltransferase
LYQKEITMMSALDMNDTQNQSLPQTTSDLSIVIVCRNNRAYLEPCLDSLYGSGLHCRFDVVIVDNGSTDGTQAMLEDKFSDVQIIQNLSNVGLSKASNQGIQATKGQYILLLNDDTLVNGPSLARMVEFLNEHSEAAAVGGQLLNPDGSVQSCYNKFPTLKEEFLVATRMGEFLLRTGYPAKMMADGIRAVDWIGSACLMLRRAALEKVGLLDEEFFIYGDEADLQYRLRDADWKIYFLPDVYTIHFGGRSMNRWSRRRMVYRGKLLFYKKNYGLLRTSLLRTLLGILSFGKLLLWVPLYVLPNYRERVDKEWRSNLDVIKLCVDLR